MKRNKVNYPDLDPKDTIAISFGCEGAQVQDWTEGRNKVINMDTKIYSGSEVIVAGKLFAG